MSSEPYGCRGTASSIRPLPRPRTTNPGLDTSARNSPDSPALASAGLRVQSPAPGRRRHPPPAEGVIPRLVRRKEFLLFRTGRGEGVAELCHRLAGRQCVGGAAAGAGAVEPAEPDTGSARQLLLASAFLLSDVSRRACTGAPRRR